MTDEDLERRLHERLQDRAAAVQPRPGAWAAIDRRVRRTRRRSLVLALPALATAAVLVVVGLLVLRADGPGPGPRVRTNPALPGEGPALPSSTTEDRSGAPVVVTSGPGWHLLVEARDGVGACGQILPQRERTLDPSFCGASQKEFEDRGLSLAFIGRPPAGGAPTTLPPATVAYGFVPVESADVVLDLDDGSQVTFEALPLDGAVDAFAGELRAGAAATKITVYDGDGRTLYEEDLRGAD